MVVLEVVENKAKFSRKILDNGFVNIVDIMGDDYRILQSARVSTGGEASKGEKQDRGLYDTYTRTNTIHHLNR